MKHKTLFKLLLFAVATGTALAHAELFDSRLNAQNCTTDVMDAEPRKQVGSLGPRALPADVFAADATFNIGRTNQLMNSAKINGENVSSAHIVTILTSEFQKIRSIQIEKMGKGELNPVETNKNYSLTQLKSRLDSMAKFRNEVVNPILEDNYRLYVRALKTREDDRKNSGASAVAQASALALSNQQVTALNQILDREIPGIKEKIGSIPLSQIGQPSLSYRDGVIVKIRFEKMVDGVAKRMTIYPQFLVTQLFGEDEYFRKGLELWVEFSREKEKSATQYSSDLRRKAREIAESDLRDAQDIGTRASQLTQGELLTLLAVFEALAQNHIPQCAEALDPLKNEVKALMGAAKTSMQLPQVTRDRVDNLVKNLMFYQDQYDAISRAAALVLSQKR